MIFDAKDVADKLHLNEVVRRSNNPPCAVDAMRVDVRVVRRRDDRARLELFGQQDSATTVDRCHGIVESEPGGRLSVTV